jgi:multiple sugar transport system substrate-binding protein
MKFGPFKTLSILGVCVALAGGCGASQGANTGDSGKIEGRGPVTFAAGKDDTGTYPEIVKMWNQTHPQEQVRLIELPSSADDQRQQMVQNAQTKSDAFTVLDLDVVWTTEFAANRWIMPLPKDQVDMSRYLKPVVETANYRDRLYAVPSSSDGSMLYYRKDLLAKVGAQPPKTWDEMKQICAKVSALPEAAGASCFAGQYEKYEGLTANFAEVINSAGGTIVDGSGKPKVNTPEAKKGLDFLAEGFKSGMIPREALTSKETEARRAFGNGKLIFGRAWPNQWSQITKTDGSSQVADKVAVTPLPGLSGPGVSSLGGHNLALSAYGKNKATALDFIKFFTDEKQQRFSMDHGSLAPTLAHLYDDPELQAKYPYLPVLKQSINGAEPRPRVVKYGEVTQAIQDNAYKALSGEKSSDQALSDLQVRLEELIKP